MKYPYAVKANGKWYQPNEEIQDNNSANVTPDVSVQPTISIGEETYTSRRGRKPKDQ